VRLALLAIQDRPLKHVLAACTLWPDVTGDRTGSNLRASLSRLHGVVREAVEVNPADLRLASGVRVELRESRALAGRLLDGLHRPLLEAAVLSGAVIARLSEELLSGWYDEWVLLEAEDWQQIRLHALEALSGSLTSEGR
jgi:SARP family transcriptional regulator, regulator of embCAB operon